jgi:voltage-gated potassium channel Kch
MKGPDSAHFAFSLAQGGEFAFVLISFCLGLGLLLANQAAVLVAIVAISMALAPMLIITNENFIQPLFARGGQIRDADVIDKSARVIIAGHGRFGMTVGRMLQGKGYKTVVLDHDAEQIDALRRFGFKLFYGDASRMDLLEAAGARTAEVLVVAIDEREKISEIVATAKKHFPHLRIFSRAFDRVHAYELINAGVEDVYREVFSSSLDMGEQVLVALGQNPSEARRAARTFKSFDEKVMREQARHAGDNEKMVDIVRASRAELSRILAGDRNLSPLAGDEAPDDNDGRS